MGRRDQRKDWDDWPPVKNPDPLVQVGKTVNGIPVSQRTLSGLVASAAEMLELKQTDTLLDICCGNGLLSLPLSERCAHVYGVDFSGVLLRTALSSFSGPKTSYLLGDAADLPIHWRRDDRVLKVLVHEALQSFDAESFDALLGRLHSIGASLLVFAGIPDRDRKFCFYNTPRRKISYLSGLVRQNDLLGTWWAREQVQAAAESAGFRANITDSAAPYSAHYRFDAVLRKNGTPPDA